MKKSILFLIIALLVSFTVTYAQVPVVAARQVQKIDNAKVGGTNPMEASAALEVESTTQGFLIPRMTTAQRTAIVTPAAGLQVYDTDIKDVWLYNGTTWVRSGSKFVDGTDPLNAVYTAGSVGVGTAEPNASAALEISSTTKGFLPPRVALTSLTSPSPLANFVQGMIVQNTATAGTAPNQVSPGLYVAGAVNWTRLDFRVTGASGDVSVSGETTNPIYKINNNVINSSNLNSAIKVGGGVPSTTSVALEVAGGNRGFVVSTTSNISSIREPIAGMMVFSTTDRCLRIFDGLVWSNCLTAAAGQSSTGGSGIATSYNCGTELVINPVYGQRFNGTKPITATVSTIGDYNISATSTTLPGLIFSASGTFTATGSQTINLRAIGVANVNGNHTFTLSTSPNCQFNVSVNTAGTTYVTTTGSNFKAFYNGRTNNVYMENSGLTEAQKMLITSHTRGEIFSDLAGCVSKTISQTSPADCTGSVTGTSGKSYPLRWINGQCWMASNLQEIPANYPTNTGTTWRLSLIQDQGQWGFFNGATQDGTAGWGYEFTPAPWGTYGMLYQWSAAMNGSTLERAQGSCPTGFHIPSDCEFSFLEHGLGMSISDNDRLSLHTTEYRDGTATNSSYVSMKLRLTGQGSGANNASGFAAPLAGQRRGDGSFNLPGSWTHFWTSTPSGALRSFRRHFRTGATATGFGVVKDQYDNNNALSVRCLKD